MNYTTKYKIYYGGALTITPQNYIKIEKDTDLYHWTFHQLSVNNTINNTTLFYTNYENIITLRSYIAELFEIDENDLNSEFRYIDILSKAAFINNHHKIYDIQSWTYDFQSIKINNQIFIPISPGTDMSDPEYVLNTIILGVLEFIKNMQDDVQYCTKKPISKICNRNIQTCLANPSEDCLFMDQT
jgi:hypothetical protein